jgi:hypothetical protein
VTNGGTYGDLVMIDILMEICFFNYNILEKCIYMWQIHWG